MALDNLLKEEIAASVWDDLSWMRDTFRTPAGNLPRSDAIMKKVAKQLNNYPGRESILREFIMKFSDVAGLQPYRARNNSRVIIFEPYRTKKQRKEEGAAIIFGSHGGVLKYQHIGLSRKDNPDIEIFTCGIDTFTNVNSFGNPGQLLQAKQAMSGDNDSRTGELVHLVNQLPDYVRELLLSPDKQERMRSILVKDKSEAVRQKNRLLDLLDSKIRELDNRLLKAIVTAAFPPQYANSYLLQSRDPSTFLGYFKHNFDDLRGNVQVSFATLTNPLHELTFEQKWKHVQILLDDYLSNNLVSTRAFLSPYLLDLEYLLHASDDDPIRVAAEPLNILPAHHLLLEPELPVFDACRVIAVANYDGARQKMMELRRRGTYLVDLVSGQSIVEKIIKDSNHPLNGFFDKEFLRVLKTYDLRRTHNTMGITSMDEQAREDDAVVITARLAKATSWSSVDEAWAARSVFPAIPDLVSPNEHFSKVYTMTLDDFVARLDSASHHISDEFRQLFAMGLYRPDKILPEQVHDVSQWVPTKVYESFIRQALEYLDNPLFSGELRLSGDWVTTYQQKVIRSIINTARDIGLASADDVSDYASLAELVEEGRAHGFYRNVNDDSIRVVRQNSEIVPRISIAPGISVIDPLKANELFDQYCLVDDDLKTELEMLSRRGWKRVVDATGLTFDNNSDRRALAREPLLMSYLEKGVALKLLHAAQNLPESVKVFAQSKGYSATLRSYALANDMIFDNAQKGWYMFVPVIEKESVLKELSKMRSVRAYTV